MWMKANTLTSNLGTAPRDPAAGSHVSATYCCPGRDMTEQTPGVSTCQGCPCTVVLDNADTRTAHGDTFRRVTAVHVCPDHQ